LYPGRYFIMSNYAVKTKKIARKASWYGVRLFFLTGLSFVILYPVYTMIAAAFTSKADMLDSTVFLIPRTLSVYAFTIASELLNYQKSLALTLFIAVTVAAVQTLICMMAGYGFGRFRLPLKKLLFAMVLFTVVVPPQLYMSTLYLQFKDFSLFGLFKTNLLNSFTPLYLLALTGNGIKNGLFIYIFRQNFRNMPNEIEEAALVDGAGTFKTFSHVMLPNAMASIVTIFLFSFVWQYNDSFYMGLFMTSPDILSINFNIAYHWDTQMLQTMGLSDADIFNPVFAATVRSACALLILAPVIAVYLALQRFFVESVERAGVVG